MCRHCFGCSKPLDVKNTDIYCPECEDLNRCIREKQQNEIRKIREQLDERDRLLYTRQH